MNEFNSIHIQNQLARHRQGDPAALDELIRPAMCRLELLARKMLRGFPPVARWEGTSDVLQNSLLRLTRALKQEEVTSTRHFFGLAATQIRRELRDLAAHYNGPQGMGRHHHSDAGDPAAERQGERAVSRLASPCEEDLDRYVALHEAVDGLPAEEREVFMLLFYLNWTQPQVAELFQVDERTVRRRWASAIMLLRGKLQCDLPS